MRILIPFFLMAAMAPAQIVSVGVKAGVPVTAALPTYGDRYSGIIDTGRWTVGPTIEFHLLHGFSVEADVLYRGYRQQQLFISGEQSLADGTIFPAISNSSQSNTKAWDFPLLLKYRIGERRYRPFVAAGATFSHTSSDVTSSQICLSATSICEASVFRSYYNVLGRRDTTSNEVGPTAGVGVEFRIGKFKLAPEVRYTHLSNPTRNLATLMLGFTF